MILWRISNYATLDGRGGLLASARWHTRGRRVVYLAESAAGALSEVLVHLELDSAHLPKHYKLLKVEAPDNVSMQTLQKHDLPSNWAEDVIETRSVGDRWLALKSSALLKVPSVVVPETFNLLLNPEHGEAASIRPVWHREYPWDKRLLR